MTTKPEEIARVFKVGDRVIGWDESALCSWHAKPGVVEGPCVTEERVVVRMDHGVTLTFHVSNLRLDNDPAREEASFIDEDGVKRFNLPEPAAKAPDPYTLHRWAGYHEEALRGMTDNHPRNLAARARLIAALQAEQAWRERPDMLATFPKAARNPR